MEAGDNLCEFAGCADEDNTLMAGAEGMCQTGVGATAVAPRRRMVCVEIYPVVVLETYVYLRRVAFARRDS